MYSVHFYDRAGEFDFDDAEDFAGCLLLVAAFARKYPDKVVRVSNLDRCDYDTNGLTDGEREAIDDAIDLAREAA